MARMIQIFWKYENPLYFIIFEIFNIFWRYFSGIFDSLYSIICRLKYISVWFASSSCITCYNRCGWKESILKSHMAFEKFKFWWKVVSNILFKYLNIYPWNYWFSLSILVWHHNEMCGEDLFISTIGWYFLFPLKRNIFSKFVAIIKCHTVSIVLLYYSYSLYDCFRC